MSEARWRWLGIPWEEEDCLQISLHYLREVGGYPIPDIDAVRKEDVPERFWARWEQILPGVARHHLDLFVTPGEPGKLHVGVLLEDEHHVLSSFRAVGSRAIPLVQFTARGILGIYRWRKVG